MELIFWANIYWLKITTPTATIFAIPMYTVQALTVTKNSTRQIFQLKNSHEYESENSAKKYFGRK